MAAYIRNNQVFLVPRIAAASYLNPGSKMEDKGQQAFVVDSELAHAVPYRWSCKSALPAEIAPCHRSSWCHRPLAYGARKDLSWAPIHMF